MEAQSTLCFTDFRAIFILVGLHQCMWLPKAELNIKNSTRWGLSPHLVEFLVFNSITHAEKKCGSNRFVPRCFKY